MDGEPVTKAKSQCKYLTKWEETYTYLMKSNVSQCHAFREICRMGFSVTRREKWQTCQT